MPAAHRALVTRAVRLLQQPRRHDERGAEQKEQPPSGCRAGDCTRRRCAIPPPPSALPSRPRRDRERHRDREPARITTSCTRLTHAELRSPPAMKYETVTSAPMAQPASTEKPPTTFSTAATPRSCAARMVSVPSQMSERDQAAHRAAVAPLEEIADASDRRASSPRATCAGRPRTPAPAIRGRPIRSTTTRSGPRRIAERRGADGGARADVGGEERREDETGAETRARRRRSRRPARGGRSTGPAR